MSNAKPAPSDTNEVEVRRVVESLTRREAGGSPEAIEQTVRETFDQFSDARVRDFVGLFVERRARERLRQHQGTARTNR